MENGKQCNSVDFSKRNNNVRHCNIEDQRRRFEFRQRTTEMTAQKLVKTLNAPDCYKFFLKAAWKLPEVTIWNIVEKATTDKKINSPARYVVRALNIQMSM